MPQVGVHSPAFCPGRRGGLCGLPVRLWRTSEPGVADERRGRGQGRDPRWEAFEVF